MKFEFATAHRIIFGRGSLAEAPAIAAQLGAHAFVVTGSGLERATPLCSLLARSRVSIAGIFLQKGEPTVESVLQGAQEARAGAAKVVVGIGGGSALDAAKAIAALAANPGDPLEFLEVIGRAQPLRNPPLPCIAIPTTAGTGAEVTRNAVLGSPQHRVKVSLRSPLMLPRAAIIDPELTYELPPSVTASSGMDALTQLIEPFVSARANPLSDGVCREALPRAARALRSCADGKCSAEARTEMAFASLSGGLALANSGLGAVHGFAAPLGGMHGAPHGAICAVLLPHVMRSNLKALAERAPASQALARYDEVARLLTGSRSAPAEEGVLFVERLCQSFALTSLGALGVSSNEFAEAVERARKASSMQANPIELTPAELQEILEAAA